MFNRGQKISRILSRQTGYEALKSMYDILGPIYKKKPKKLREAEQVVCFIMAFVSQADKDLKSFYLSDAGDLTIEVSNSLSRIGHDEAYDFLYESMQVFSGMISKERLVRQGYYDNHQEICDNKWSVLDKEFPSLKANLINKTLDYVRENILEFR